MLVEFRDANGSPVYINPQHVIAVREEKHFGRPGVGSGGEYRDTLILTAKCEFNVQDSPDAVVREVNRASLEMLRVLEGGDAVRDAVQPPDEEPG